jgi:hypothetical protein
MRNAKKEAVGLQPKRSVTGKIIGDDKDVTRRMVGFDVSE